jgi:hypothetical protein
MTHPHMITDAAAALEFAFGGNARFTLVSRKTGDRKTFRVRKAHDRDDLYFAQLLTGPDNIADYTYLGFIKAPRKALIAGKKGNPNHPAFIALDWALANIDAGKMPEQLEFWHEGRCSRCARVLTDPASIERGVGPECAKKED